jgi:protein-S-isoprenylcysteine O-methyltransferase Ste14
VRTGRKKNYKNSTVNIFHGSSARRFTAWNLKKNKGTTNRNIFLITELVDYFLKPDKMKIKLIIIIVFSILYGLFEIFMSRRQRSKREISTSGDKGSIWLLTISISIGFWLSFIIASTKIGRIYHWNLLFTIGAFLAIIGLIIRVTSILALKQQFTYIVTKIENHELIETGLYKIIRHPGYLGQLIIFLGIATSLSNWISILLMIIPVSLGYLNRIKIEEKFMVKHMGQKYLEYQTRTKRLIPAIY